MHVETGSVFSFTTGRCASLMHMVSVFLDYSSIESHLEAVDVLPIWVIRMKAGNRWNSMIWRSGAESCRSFPLTVLSSLPRTEIFLLLSLADPI